MEYRVAGMKFGRSVAHLEGMDRFFSSVISIG